MLTRWFKQREIFNIGSLCRCLLRLRVKVSAKAQRKQSGKGSLATPE